VFAHSGDHSKPNRTWQILGVRFAIEDSNIARLMSNND
jgi:hypothetical protein